MGAYMLYVIHEITLDDFGFEIGIHYHYSLLTMSALAVGVGATALL